LVIARETGWSEADILALPMETALEYYHAALWANGAWTVPVQASVSDQLLKLSQWRPPPDEDDFDQ
jgi:hypothetical protein